MLFSSVIQNAAKNAAESEGATAAAPKESDAKSLNDVAREYEESRAQKRKYEEVETFTGEENEVNIVDVSSMCWKVILDTAPVLHKIYKYFVFTLTD